MRLARLLRTSSFRLTLLYAGLFGVSAMILFAVIYWSTAGFMSRQLDDSITAELNEVQADAAGHDLDGLRRIVQGRVDRAPRGMYYLLEDAQGRALAGNMPPVTPVPGLRCWPGPHLMPQSAQPHGLCGRGLQAVDGAYLLVGLDNFQLEEMQELIARAFLWGLGATAVLAFAGGTVMSLSLLRRVETISRTSRDIVGGDLSRRIPVRGSDDEFDHLASSLNAMLDQIQGLMEGLRQVSSDIAHDLRTPLTRLRQRLELAQRRGDTVVTLRAALDSSILDVDAILDTFGALLRIAQIEAGTRKAGFVALDLSELLHTMIEIYQPVAEEKGQRLTETIAPDLVVRGDRELLTQMLANLIENAIRHSPGATAITVTGERRHGIVEVVVADGGPGIPEPLRRKVFQRFYRLETSRTTPGSGLGLSLVAAIAALHDVTVALDDNRPGLQAALRFPLP